MDILRKGVENGWTQNHIAKEIIEISGGTLDETVKLVKNEFRKAVK